MTYKKLQQTFRGGLTLAALLLATPWTLPAQISTNATADNTTLKYALVFSRHGVRPPTKTNDSYNLYATQDFPVWSTAVGNLTPHGAQLMTIMGTYYRQYFISQGLLTGSDQADAPNEYFYADNAQRTFATGQALAAGLLPSVAATVNAAPSGTTDPIMYPTRLNIGSPDPVLGAASVNGRMGSNPAAVALAYKTQLAELESVLLNMPITDPAYAPSWRTSVGAMPFSVTPGTGGNVVNPAGNVDTGATLAENFIMQYCEGMPSGNIGWGRLSRDQITDIAKLRIIDYDLLDHTQYPAQAAASNLLLRIVNSLNQAATGTATLPSFGAPSQKLATVVTHDIQIASVAGLMHADWAIPTFAYDDSTPGGAIVFELRQSSTDSSYVVRTYFTSATMDQQHDATVLSLQTPPSVSPIFLPNASTSNVYFDTPLATFTSAMMGALNTKFTSN